MDRCEDGERWPGECWMAYNSLKVCFEDGINCLRWEVGGWGWSVAPRGRRRELPLCHIGRNLRAQIQMKNPNLEVTHSRIHTNLKNFQSLKRRLFHQSYFRVCLT